MKKYSLFFGILSLALLALSHSVQAQAIQIGAKVPEFELLATDGKRYGLKEGIDRISILLFIGYN